MLKLKMMLCVMMLPLVVVGCTSKQSVSQCVKPPPPPAWIAQPPWLANPRWTGLFHPQRLITMQKQLEGTDILLGSADRVAHIDGQLMQLLTSNTHWHFQRKYKCLNIKTEQSIYECLLGFCFNNIFLPPQILAASIFQKRRNDGWSGFLWCCCGLFWTVNVCWAHPVISRAAQWRVAFSWVLLRCFLKFRIVCVEN